MFLGVKDVAKLFTVSEKTIYRWLSAGTIPHTRVGDQYRFSQPDLLAWANAEGRIVSPKALSESEVDHGDLPSLHAAIEEGGIYYRIGGSDPRVVIEEIVSVMRLPPGVDREYVHDALIARESLASTAVGDGIAIPHMRHPFPQIGTPLVSLCFLSEPREWGAMDGKPVRILFVPCCPNMRTHLHLLSRISFAVRDPKWRRLLESEAVRGEILDRLSRVEDGFPAAGVSLRSDLG